MGKKRKRIKKQETKNPVGRPPLYNDVIEFENKVKQYFDSCFTYRIDKNGNFIKDPWNPSTYLKIQTKPFTISGLADALDMTRETLLRYQEREDFKEIIEKAKRKCETYAEERLFDKEGVKGAIFSLTNNYNNWHNKQEVGGKVGVGTIEDYLKEVEDKDEY